MYEEDVSEETHQHTYLRQTIDQAVFSNDHDRMMVRKRRCSDVDSSLVDIHAYLTMNVSGIDAQYQHGEAVRLAVKPVGGIGRWQPGFDTLYIGHSAEPAQLYQGPAWVAPDHGKWQ